MTAHGSSYSTQRPASPELFASFGNPGDDHEPQEIVEQLVSTPGTPISYWIVGEIKTGKSSFLLKLEDLLLERVDRPDTRWVPLPLYLSCADHTDLASFYSGLLQRVGEVYSELRETQRLGEVGLSLQACKLSNQTGIQTATSPQLLELLIHDLGILISQLSSDCGRLVLLIDDAEEAAVGGWGVTLFAHLRSLLTDIEARGPGFSQKNVALILASRRPRPYGSFSGLQDVLQEISLEPLPWKAVRRLMAHGSSTPPEIEWVERVFGLTGGQPWLLQYVMEQFLISCDADWREFEMQLKTITGSRFLRSPERRAVLEHWLDSLPGRGMEILAHLTLSQGRGLTIKEVAAALGLSRRTLQRDLRQALTIGFIYKRRVSKERKGRAERLFLSQIFESFFLERTGGHIFRKCIDELRNQFAASPTSSAAIRGKAFALLVSLEHDLILADGLYLATQSAGPQFTGNLQKLLRRTRQVRELQALNDAASDLAQDFARLEWMAVWEHYFKAVAEVGETARFVLRTEDLELLDFPVELLKFEGGYLGLRVPLFLELAGLRRERAYHLSVGCFPRGEPIHLLMVAASSGGVHGEQHYHMIPHCEQEIAQVLEALRQEGGKIQLGEVVVLSDHPVADLPDDVRVEEATAENFERALKGGFGIDFHLLHFCGHHVFQNKDQDSGLLFRRDEFQLELLHLARLFHAVEKSALRFAFFNSCESGFHEVGAEQRYLGAGYACLRAGVPVAVGLRWPVRDSEAIQLGRYFYSALARHAVPEVALWQTRKELEVKEPASILWAAPVMLAC